MRKPLPLAQWAASTLHQRALAYMRWKRDEAAAKEPKLKPSDEMACDARLWRFLVACSFRGGEAAEMYVAALRWRVDRGMDVVRSELRAANAGFFGGGAAGLRRPTCLLYTSPSPRDS